MSTVHKITEQTFEAEVLGAELPVLVDFTAAWCPPCRALEPIVHALAKEQAGRLKVGTIDGDESPALASRLKVKGFPTVVLFSGGKEVGRHLGLATKDKLVKMIEGASRA
jgi:thioredoxin 1